MASLTTAMIIPLSEVTFTFQISNMAAVGNRPKNAPPPRKPSPVRGGPEEELTFRQKLEEIKRQRTAGESGQTNIPIQNRMSRPEEPVVAKQVQTLTGVKTFLQSFGDWVEVVSAKSGKVYYYNKRTMVNQWTKPEAWLAEEVRLNPPLPEDIPPPPEPPLPAAEEQPPPPPSEEGMAGISNPAKIKMKLKGKKKLLGAKKKLKKQLAKIKNEEEEAEANLPLAYQKNAPKTEEDSSCGEDEEEEGDDGDKKRKLAMSDAFDTVDDDDTEATKLAKLDSKDEIGHIDIRLPPPLAGPSSALGAFTLGVAPAGPPIFTEPPPPPSIFRKFDRTVAGPERALALHQGSAAALAYQNISKVPESQVLYGEQASLMSSTSLATGGIGNPTHFTEYNLPCCLRRCKFPKEQVSHAGMVHSSFPL